MSITIGPATEAKLREVAIREGQDVHTLADMLLNMALDWVARDRAEAVEGIRAGIAAFEEGRFGPFRVFVAEHRTRR